MAQNINADNKNYEQYDDNEAIALYIHVPFCKQKCFYCDFPSYAGMEKYMDEYVNSLSEEIRRLDKVNIYSIFVGGGTPTYLSLRHWEKIADALEYIHVPKQIEFTVEGNPGTFNMEVLKLLKFIGVNRLSIGLQAWQKTLLKKLGRIHNVEQFISAYDMARSVGFDNINVDIMFGIPDQTMTDWKETLKNLVNVQPEHISCYSLIVEEGTPFFRWYEKDALKLPDEEVERNMYTYARNYLNSHDYSQYEISNYGKNGKYCKHNLVYWNMKPYIGCGASAHSFINGKRMSNTSNIKEYISKIKNNEEPYSEIHINTWKDNVEEFMFLGLRKIKGISTEEFNIRFGENINNVFGSTLKKYMDKGLILIDNDRIYLSPHGIEISNSILCEFILD